MIKHYERVLKAVEENDLDMRFFEILTMMALLEFQDQGAEYAVLECGIGGRLDSTNIIDEPVCSVITTIGLDHMDVIGNSLEEIAYEKGGVIKKNIPCIVGPTARMRKPIIEKANEVGSQLIDVGNLPTYLDINNKMVQEIMKIVCQKERIALDSETINFLKKV